MQCPLLASSVRWKLESHLAVKMKAGGIQLGMTGCNAAYFREDAYLCTRRSSRERRTYLGSLDGLYLLWPMLTFLQNRLIFVAEVTFCLPTLSFFTFSGRGFRNP